MGVDRHSIDGKLGGPDESFDVAVIGAGPAGTAAAIDAARSGKRVLLIDEHPVRGELMGNDVPYLFGARMTSAVQNSGRMIEQLFVSNPALETAFEVGVDVRLGTCAWGLYANGPAMRALPRPLLGIADAERSSMVGFDRLVLATGCRDVVLGFPGWNQPGVIGAQGFAALVKRYDAFAGRRVLIVGAGDLGLATAMVAAEHGVEVAGVLDVATDVEAVVPAGVPLFISRTISGVRSGLDGIEGATLASLHGDSPVDVDCDTIVLAIGLQPATELLDAAGATEPLNIDLVGDCAEVAPMDPATLAAWSQALGLHVTPDTLVCQCEEVSRADLLGVQPPNYLERPPAMQARSMAGLLRDGAAHPDHIKRLTRAGMGPCQGRRCREQVSCVLAAEQGCLPSEVPMASFRAPVRPVPLAVLADWQESATMREGWDVWFGIPTQWTPYALIGTAGEAEQVAALGGNMHV